MSDKSNPFKPIDKNFSHITKDCSETTFDYVTAEEKVIVKGKGEYTGWTAAIYRINKAANPMTLKGKTVKVKRKSLKKKSKTIKRVKAFTVSKAKGKRSYKLVSAKKGKKSFRKKFKINAKTGNVTLKKGLKKGTYADA